MPARHPVRLVAHRGAPRSRRENTLPAIIAAHALGASAIEIDVRRTADDVAVLVHDATLGRLWGEPRRVDAMTWCEVARVGNDLDRVPRLDAVLARLDGTGATLVLDCADPLDAFVAARTVESAADAHVRVEWCGDPAAMAAVLHVLPDARCWLAWNSLALPTDADLEALRPAVLNLDVALLTPAIVRAAHRLGLEVSCWTVDDPGLAVWAASLGVDSITTNDVLVLQAALDAPPVPPRRRVPEAVVAASAQTVAHRIAYQLVALEREHPLSAVGGSGGGVGGGTQTESASASASSDAELPAALQDAARQAEQFVRGQLRVAFPGHGVTGPAFGVAQGDDYHWYVDPIDGATNLLNGIPWTAVSLVLTRGGRPIVGVVADPWRGEVLEARAGRGSRRLDQPLRLSASDRRTLTGAAVCAELDGPLPFPGFAALMEVLTAKSCTLRIMGSGALALAQVAAGRSAGACLSAFEPTSHGAALLIVLEAGGAAFDSRGPITGFPSTGAPLLVAHPGVAEELHALWVVSTAS